MVTRSNEANARALKAALMAMQIDVSFPPFGKVRGHIELDESEAEAIVALAVQHLLKPEDRP